MPGLWHLRYHERIESVDGLFIPSRNQMAVQIHYHLNRAVTHLIFDIDRLSPFWRE